MHRNWKQGFTLMELLIVVAIIGVLVGIAIPTFNKQLEKTRESVDIASMRNAYALAAASVLLDDEIDGIKFSTFTSTSPAYYASSGVLTATAPKAYGKGRKLDANTTYGACLDYQYDASADYTGSVITVWAEDNVVHVHWAVADGNSGNTTGGGMAALENKANNLPDSLNPGELYQVYQGKVYRYNGEIYIATTTPGVFSQFFYHKPGASDSGYLYIKPTGKMLSNSDTDGSGKMTVAVAAGDIYRDGENLYIRKVNSDALQSMNPRNDPGNWVRIDLE